ncbi:DnaB-like helicase N-terminal domain-containing protein [Streptacidiphilus sp. EB129]|uniref:DnaB-like helicase N-terminal domain-containing protein n=1 Tax=Streptacidiphilus sp. EB129 TaxID=3156262 RepID=UPI00351357E5
MRTPQGTPVRAEYAVIGSLLQRPDLAEIVHRWLRFEDFVDPWMARIFRALVEQRLYTHPEVLAADPTRRLDAVVRVVMPQLQQNCTDARERVAPQVWDQLSAGMTGHLVSPDITPHREAALEYGREVLQDAIRRTVIERGEIITHFAGNHTYPNLGVVEQAAVAGVDDLADLDRRWELASPAWLTQEPTEEIPLRGAELPASTDADLLLAALVLNPKRVGMVRTLLRPRDFGGEGRPDLYRAITAADDRGEHLWGRTDLVAWALQVRSDHGYRDSGASRSDIGRMTTTVFRASVRHTATQGGTLIAHLASQGVGATRQVLGAAQRAVGAVARQARRDPGLERPVAAYGAAVAR